MASACSGPAACTACHSPESNRPLRLAGGTPLKTPFGTFYAPNISPDPDTGIGAWRPVDFVNAVPRGIGVHNEHLVPGLALHVLPAHARRGCARPLRLPRDAGASA